MIQPDPEPEEGELPAADLTDSRVASSDAINALHQMRANGFEVLLWQTALTGEEYDSAIRYVKHQIGSGWCNQLIVSSHPPPQVSTSPDASYAHLTLPLTCALQACVLRRLKQQGGNCSQSNGSHPLCIEYRLACKKRKRSRRYNEELHWKDWPQWVFPHTEVRIDANDSSVQIQ